MFLEPWQWGVAALGALLVGVSKTGIGGLGMLSVVLFAQIIPAKQATGIVLPLLIFGDLMAVASYRRHTQWRFLWKLFPWTAVGVLVGYLALDQMNDHQARVLIGLIILGLLVVHLVRRRMLNQEDAGAAAAGQDPALNPRTAVSFDTQPGWVAPAIGILAGFTTLVANAAGPLMAIYLLAMRLPKMEFVGTGAVFFLLINLFKVPFMVNLGLINGESFAINLWLAPLVFTGAIVGRRILVKIDQRLFENLALTLSAIAGIKLLW